MSEGRTTNEVNMSFGFVNALCLVAGLGMGYLYGIKCWQVNNDDAVREEALYYLEQYLEDKRQYE